MNKPLDTQLIDAPEARWQAEYAQQIGTDRPIVNRSGIPIAPLYTPRDFDLSPYFEVVKLNHLGDPRFDYRRIVWEDAPHAGAAPAPPARAAGPQRRLQRLRPAFFSRSRAS